MADQSYLIEFKTVADLKAGNDAVAVLKQSIEIARAAGQSTAALEAQLARVSKSVASVDPSKLSPASGGFSPAFKAGLNDISREVPGLEGALGVMEKLGGGTLGAVAAGFGLVAGGIALGKRALVEFGEEQEKVFGLDATLATKGILSDDFRESLQKLAQEMQDLTKIDSGIFIDSIQRLVSAGADSSNIDRLLKGVIDLAGATGRDIPEASAVMQKAIQGNFDMLGRLGIRFEKTGDQAKDLDRLLQIVADRGAGVLQARGESLNGTIRGLGLAFADSLKSTGNYLNETLHLTAAIGHLTTIMKALGAGGAETISGLDGLKNKFVESGKSAEESARDQKAFEQSLKSIEKASDEATAALGRQMAAMDELNSFNKDLIDANLKVDLAKLDQRKQAGQVTPVDFETQRAKLIAEAENKKFERDRTLAEDKIRAAQDEATRRKTEVTQLDEGTDKQEARIKRAEELKAREAELTKQLQEEDARRAVLEKARQYRQDVVQGNLGGGALLFPEKEKAEAARLVEQYNKEIADLNTRSAAAANEKVNIRAEREDTGIKSVADEQAELNRLKEMLRIAESKLADAERNLGTVQQKENTGIKRQQQLLEKDREAQQVEVNTKLQDERRKAEVQRLKNEAERAKQAAEQGKGTFAQASVAESKAERAALPKALPAADRDAQLLREQDRYREALKKDADRAEKVSDGKAPPLQIPAQAPRDSGTQAPRPPASPPLTARAVTPESVEAKEAPTPQEPSEFDRFEEQRRKDAAARKKIESEGFTGPQQPKPKTEFERFEEQRAEERFVGPRQPSVETPPPAPGETSPQQAEKVEIAAAEVTVAPTPGATVPPPAITTPTVSAPSIAIPAATVTTQPTPAATIPAPNVGGATTPRPVIEIAAAEVIVAPTPGATVPSPAIATPTVAAPSIAVPAAGVTTQPTPAATVTAPEVGTEKVETPKVEISAAEVTVAPTPGATIQPPTVATPTVAAPSIPVPAATVTTQPTPAATIPAPNVGGATTPRPVIAVPAAGVTTQPTPAATVTAPEVATEKVETPKVEIAAAEVTVAPTPGATVPPPAITTPTVPAPQITVPPAIVTEGGLSSPPPPRGQESPRSPQPAPAAPVADDTAVRQVIQQGVEQYKSALAQGKDSNLIAVVLDGIRQLTNQLATTTQEANAESEKRLKADFARGLGQLSRDFDQKLKMGRR